MLSFVHDIVRFTLICFLYISEYTVYATTRSFYEKQNLRISEPPFVSEGKGMKLGVIHIILRNLQGEGVTEWLS